MSATNQSNSKKSGSSNSSMVNTPASTPVTTMANGQNTTQTSPPPNNNAPKYGTLVPNRIFVGGISANTTESELLQLFSNYGTVKAAKIIQDRAGVSKGYGFITFESEDDAKRLQREADNIVLRERKLNIAPAIKKQSLQPFSRAFDASSPPAVAPGNPAQYFFQPSAVPYFQGGVAYYPQPPTGPTDPAAQQPTVYQPPSVYPPQSAPPQTAAYPPVMFPAQPIYMPQQYPMPMPYEYNYYTNGGAQYMVGSQGGPQSQVPPMQRPNSPPRAPCYTQSIPFANPPDQMYYNMPMYGPVDGTMYADAAGMDMSMSNGTLPEEFNTQDPTSTSSTPTTPASITAQSTTEIQCIASQQNNAISKDASVEEGKVIEVPQTDVNSRKSNTPVVSLLSLDQHQEKDPVSMQSGRRRKPTVSNTPPNHAQQPHHFPAQNGSFGNFAGFNYNSTYSGFPPPQAQSYGMNNFYSFAQQNNPSRTPPMMLNGFDKQWVRKWRGNDRRNVETSSMSSPRTDSNSSASVVDENRNEEKVVINSTSMTPPPAPYSPITNYNRSFYNNTRNTQNARNSSRGNHDRRYPVSNPRYNNSSSFNNSNRDYNINRSKEGSSPKSVPPISNNSYSKPPHSPISQMHAGNQHFVPPSRRNRRTVRRNGSSTLSEIGAGDAPLPNADVSEVCNKLDNLKL